MMPHDLRRIARMLVRGLLPGYVFLALLWAASAQVPRLNALWLGACTLVLALPMMLALWHQGTVRRLLALHQFQPGRGLHRWGSRRALSILWRSALSILLSATVLLQSVFFDRLEWLLLGLAPPLYLLARWVFDSVTAAQFTQPIFAQNQACISQRNGLFTFTQRKTRLPQTQPSPRNLAFKAKARKGFSFLHR